MYIGKYHFNICDIIKEERDGKSKILTCKIIKGTTAREGLEFKINESKFNEDWRKYETTNSVFNTANNRISSANRSGG